MKSLKEAEAALGRPLWFRGHRCSTFTLLPSLFRDGAKAVADPQSEIQREKLMRDSFRMQLPRQRDLPSEFLVPFQDKEENLDHISCLCVMQHYGLPTRLLDFTQSFFTAVYFALEDALKNRTESESSVPTIWILNPKTWNSTFLPFKAGNIPSMGATELDGWQQNVTQKQAVSILPSMISPRIIAQMGAFLVFGFEAMPFESYGHSHLRSIQIDPDAVDTLWKDLHLLGLRRSILFPELGSIAEDIRSQAYEGP